jgi:hypothetical protein
MRDLFLERRDFGHQRAFSPARVDVADDQQSREHDSNNDGNHGLG